MNSFASMPTAPMGFYNTSITTGYVMAPSPSYDSAYSQPPPVMAPLPTDNSGPSIVILDLSQAYRRFTRALEDVPSFLSHIDETEVVVFIIDHLRFEASALGDLYTGTVDAGVAAMGTDAIQDVERGLRAITAFGEEVFNHLRAMGLYQNGVLHFEFLCWTREELAVKRIEYPNPNDGARQWFPKR